MAVTENKLKLQLPKFKPFKLLIVSRKSVNCIQPTDHTLVFYGLCSQNNQIKPGVAKHPDMS